MNFYSRAFSVIALLGMALASLSQCRPAWAASLGLDWWNLPEMHEEMRRFEQEHARMNEREQAVIARLVAKSEVIRDLRAGRLTLALAAAKFGRLNALPPECPPDLGEYGDCAGEGERLCRQVIYWVIAADPAQAEVLRGRLETELARLLAENNGAIRLRD